MCQSLDDFETEDRRSFATGVTQNSQEGDGSRGRGNFGKEGCSALKPTDHLFLLKKGARERTFSGKSTAMGRDQFCAFFSKEGKKELSRESGRGK